MYPTLDCLGVHVHRLRWSELWTWFERQIATPPRRCATMAIVNAHTLNLAWSNHEYRAVLNSFELVLNDGAGVELYSVLAGSRLIENFNGTDLWPRIFETASSLDRQLSIYLYGARPGNAELAAAAIERAYPTVSVVGCRDGFTSDDRGVLRDIERARPDVLLVARGNPLQETWIARNRDDISATVACGVGALVDFLAGAIPRAPDTIRSLRLEWIYRLRQEPRRLFNRYIVGNPLFIARSLAHLAIGRNRSR